jgi:hypothetical protein
MSLSDPTWIQGHMIYPSKSPIYFNTQDSKWYFWDETWSNSLGPYSTQKEADAYLAEYSYWLSQEYRSPNGLDIMLWESFGRNEESSCSFTE